MVCVPDSLANLWHNFSREVRVASDINNPFIASRIPDHESVSIKAISFGDPGTQNADVL